MKLNETSCWKGMVGAEENGAVQWRLSGNGREALYDFADYADLRPYECFACRMFLPTEGTARLTITVFPFRVGRPEYMESASATVSVMRAGWHDVSIPLCAFDYPHMAPAFWRFIDRLSLRLDGAAADGIRFSDFSLRRKGRLTVAAPRFSQAGDAGETVKYTFTVAGEWDETVPVTLSLIRTGWEGMPARVMPEHLLLAPGESASCQLDVAVSQGVAPGGIETQTVRLQPGADGRDAVDLEFATVRHLPHPYIMHTAAGWREIKDKIHRCRWAVELFRQERQRAEGWAVPEPHGGSFVFETSHRFSYLSCAVVYQVTGERRYAEKAGRFLRGLCDEKAGYLSTRQPYFQCIESEREFVKSCPTMHMACSQGLVQEAEFFRDVAMGYDLIYNSGVLTPDDHRRIQKVLRAYIEFTDFVIENGDCNNFQVGEVLAALCGSMALQDGKWMRRFLYGINGFTEQLGSIILDDGWYFEGATHYCTLAMLFLFQTVQACLPWGINLRDLQVPAAGTPQSVMASWAAKAPNPFLGMSFEKFGPAKRNFRCLRQIWDAMLPYINENGVLFGNNDSVEKRMTETYDMGYWLFRRPEYARVIQSGGPRSLLYGMENLPEGGGQSLLAGARADNAGLFLLRSEHNFIQAVVKSGSHGGYHGHYDNAALLSLMCRGLSFWNPEISWFGYDSYLFKMWVQTSVSHNMAVVDDKMQEPAPTRVLLFRDNGALRACAVETVARWSDPPYGGQTPYPLAFPEEKAFQEGRSLPLPPTPRSQGDIGEYTGPVLQRRLIVVADEYMLAADYLKSGSSHDFDCVYHISGLQADASRAVPAAFRHTAKLREDPYGAGQFITGCDWYRLTEGKPVTLHFKNAFYDPADREHPLPFGENADLNLHILPMSGQQLVIGNAPQGSRIHKRVYFRVEGDGKLLQQGRFGAWVLGRQVIDLPVEGIRELTVLVNVEESSDTPAALFLAAASLTTGSGEKAEFSCTAENIRSAAGPGRDYAGGPVQIEGETFAQAIPIEPEDAKKPAVLHIHISGAGVLRFFAILGGDYPLGDAPGQRKTLAIRSTGTEAAFITVLEPQNGSRRIETLEYSTQQTVIVHFSDGSIHRIGLANLFAGQISRLALPLTVAHE